MQYDETDLDFVQRLLEHEGIMYFFEYADGEHTLVLTDAMSKLKPAPGYEKVPYHLEGHSSRREVEYINEWIPGSSVRPGAYAHTDYDFKKPGADLMAKSDAAVQPQGGAGRELSPARRASRGRARRQPGARSGARKSRRCIERIAASGTVRGLLPAAPSSWKAFRATTRTQEYLVRQRRIPAVRSRLPQPTPTSTGETFQRRSSCVAPTTLPFRPPRITPRPIMRGPQTATVVGPSGEEIFTDKYARVKVQFHWDRLGKKDENSSCFVRVSQTWAGSGWGFIQIPRIGQEVIVDFLEGDPDRPIITGRVYNASEMPPYGLAGQRDAVGLEVELLARRRRLQRADVRGQGRLRTGQFPGAEGPQPADQARSHQASCSTTSPTASTTTPSIRSAHNLDEDVGNNKTVKVGVDQTTNIGSNDTETVGVEPLADGGRRTRRSTSVRTRPRRSAPTIRRRWRSSRRSRSARPGSTRSALARRGRVGAVADQHHRRHARLSPWGRPEPDYRRIGQLEHCGGQSVSRATRASRSAASRASAIGAGRSASIGEDDATERRRLPGAEDRQGQPRRGRRGRDDQGRQGSA